MKITCYGGVGQIGGNKILLEDGDARLFFDFGMSFGERGLFFEEYLNPRPGAGLLDVVEMGLLPPLEGLLRPDLLPPGPFWEHYRSRRGYLALPEVDGVLVSHAHVDHNGYISFLRGETPIYSTAMTALIGKAMQDSGQSDFEREACYFVPREEKNGVLQATNYRQVPARQRPYRFFDLDSLSHEALAFWTSTPGARKLDAVAPQRATIIGGLPVRCYPVDHSIYGASAYAVETSAGWVAYTGDLRLSGGGSDRSRQFIAEIQKLKPTVLICEGTRLTGKKEESTPVSEEQVRENALREIKGCGGLVVADFGPRNIERLQVFLEVARETGRYLVVLDKDIYLLDAMHLVDPSVPTLDTEPRLAVYQDLRSSLSLWQRDLRDRYAHRFVSSRQVANHLGEFILCLSFWDIKNLIDINPREGLYLYSSSEVYNEEQGMDIQRLTEWLRHFGLRDMGVPEETQDEAGKNIWQVPESERGYHASGHASGEELLQMIQEIAPQTLVPVHTEHPELFVERLRGSDIEVRVPGYGVATEF